MEVHTTEPLQLAIAASHPGVRGTLARLVEREPGIALIALLSDHHAAARCLLHHHPHVMVVAFADALRDGAAAIRTLATLAPTTALVVATTATGEAYTSLATAAGAAELVALDAPAGALVAAITRSAAR